jgi:hypothetical protein
VTREDVFLVQTEDTSSYGGDPTRGKTYELTFFRRYTLVLGFSRSLL